MCDLPRSCGRRRVKRLASSDSPHRGRSHLGFESVLGDRRPRLCSTYFSSCALHGWPDQTACGPADVSRMGRGRSHRPGESSCSRPRSRPSPDAFACCPECARRSGLSSASIDAAFESYRESAQSLGLTLIPLDINAAADFSAAVALIESKQADGVLLAPNGINAKLRHDWVAFEAAQRVPMMADYRASGCLLSYGPDYAAMFRRLAEIAAQILNSAKPGDLAMGRWSNQRSSSSWSISRLPEQSACPPQERAPSG